MSWSSTHDTWKLMKEEEERTEKHFSMNKFHMPRSFNVLYLQSKNQQQRGGTLMKSVSATAVLNFCVQWRYSLNPNCKQSSRQESISVWVSFLYSFTMWATSTSALLIAIDKVNFHSCKFLSLFIELVLLRRMYWQRRYFVTTIDLYVRRVRKRIRRKT